MKGAANLSINAIIHCAAQNARKIKMIRDVYDVIIKDIANASVLCPDLCFSSMSINSTIAYTTSYKLSDTLSFTLGDAIYNVPIIRIFSEIEKYDDEYIDVNYHSIIKLVMMNELLDEVRKNGHTLFYVKSLAE